MSGGHFNYKQYWIKDIADSIELELDRQGQEKPRNELYYDKEHYDKYPEDMFYPTYSIIVQEKMKEAIKQLRIAAIYTQRIDWFLSGDDSEESFIERLGEELENIE